MDTLGIFLTLKTVDMAGEWDRIWLEFGEPGPSASGRHKDPLPPADDQWNGQPITATCANAIRAAVILADGHGLMPVSAGVLALCLVGEPTTAASCALGATSGHRHAVLLELVQEALVGSHWPNVNPVLQRCFELAASTGPAGKPSSVSGTGAEDDIGIPQFTAQMADRFEALLAVLDRFLRLTSPSESGMLLEQHPELLSTQIDEIIEKLIGEAEKAGHTADADRFRKRRDYLDRYRILLGRPLTGHGEPPRFGECPPTAHVLTDSIVERPGYVATAIGCAVCHVGCLVEMTMAAGGVINVNYSVFPADGCETISPEMTMWAVATCEESIKDLEEKRVPFRRGTPAVGFRPDSLRLHAKFSR